MAQIIETSLGKLEGAIREGHLAFLGIPYAAPPVGERRFAPPQAAEPWAGVRDATQYAPSCPQPPSPLPGMMAGPADEALCLNLNVFTPAAGGAKRPVMVWIHGGAFTTGSGRQAMYDGGALARRGDVVVVTVNYRLGALGWLMPDEGSDGARSNVGLLDQISALRWVQENIEGFGGDAANVTIFGESAGGMSVTTLMATSAARGLFHKAIPQSGAAQATLSREQSAEATAELSRELGHASFSLDKLRAASPENLIAAQVKTIDKLQRDRLLAWAPVVDGTTLPEHPLEAVRGGYAADIPLLIGSTADEWRLFTIALPEHRDMDEVQLRQRIGRRLTKLGGGDPDEMIGLYDGAGECCEVFDAMETDRLFRLPAIQLAEAQHAHQRQTFMYRFSWPSPAVRGRLGACHAVELPFVFGTLDAPGMDKFAGTGAAAEALSSQVMDAWVAFARHGDPARGGAVDWAPFDALRRTTFDFAADSRVVERPGEERREAWAALLED
ncbi:MAG: carboxylesterase/lipase family protein [Deltaproteobacteria bacterium]